MAKKKWTSPKWLDRTVAVVQAPIKIPGDAIVGLGKGAVTSAREQLATQRKAKAEGAGYAERGALGVVNVVTIAGNAAKGAVSGLAGAKAAEAAAGATAVVGGVIGAAYLSTKLRGDVQIPARPAPAPATQLRATDNPVVGGSQPRREPVAAAPVVGTGHLEPAKPTRKRKSSRKSGKRKARKHAKAKRPSHGKPKRKPRARKSTRRRTRRTRRRKSA